MPFNNLYKNIFDKNETDAESAVMLQQIAKDYPYFTLAHLFLLKQTGTFNDQYNPVAAKTALHFNNPFILQGLLQKITEPLSEEIVYEVEPSVTYTEEIITAPENDHPEIIEDVEMPAIDAEETDAYITEEIKEPFNNEILNEAEPPVVYQEKIIMAPENEQPGIIEEVEMPALTPEETTVYPTEEIKEPKVEEEPMIFEPLFATDYFASQGIKLSNETLPSDKLGKQLKSFTDWLKTMKKVHESKLPPGNEALDISVQTLAEKSNQEEDVLTESMAEVFLQQGKLNKAKEIYEKLSLLNPSKIAYFAAKIEQIQ